MSNYYIEQNYWANVDTEALAGSTQDTVRTVDEKVRALGLAFDRRLAEIDNDRSLSVVGKQQRRGEAVNTFAQRLESEIEPLIDRVVNDIDVLEKRRMPPLSSRDPAVVEMRGAEVRSFIRQMDVVFRPAALLDRAKIGDADFINAVADSPTDTLVDPGALAAAREALKVATFPAISKQLDQTARALVVVRLVVADLKRRLGIAADPIAELARGKPATSANGSTSTTISGDMAVDSGARRLATFSD